MVPGFTVEDPLFDGTASMVDCSWSESSSREAIANCKSLKPPESCSFAFRLRRRWWDLEVSFILGFNSENKQERSA